MPAPDRLTRISRFLSLVLRHRPESIGLTLNEAGWASVDELLRCIGSSRGALTLAELREIVASNDKQRFAFSDDGRRIRASQGHSVDVDLGLPPVAPPEHLFHGTATRFLDSIRTHGLRPASRRHVHLSPDHETAVRVGSRHGRPVVLIVLAGRLAASGHPFYRSENGVWLTPHVPFESLAFPDSIR